MVYIHETSNLSWSEEIEFLKNSGLDIDMESLLQARKRILVRDLFYDPEEAERRRRAQEVIFQLLLTLKVLSSGGNFSASFNFKVPLFEFDLNLQILTRGMFRRRCG